MYESVVTLSISHQIIDELYQNCVWQGNGRTSLLLKVAVYGKMNGASHSHSSDNVCITTTDTKLFTPSIRDINDTKFSAQLSLL